MLAHITLSIFLEPSSKKKLKPVSSIAKKAPFFIVARLSFRIFLMLTMPSSIAPIALVIQRNENSDTESGTFCKKTYWIAAKNVIKISPIVARLFLDFNIVLLPFCHNKLLD